ncbi:CoA transferase [Streptomyces sp. NPDC050560]|uniref:CoA transferase n=1 Tax=Streptomyces sp. NPDC050560 TaxID=3365630 RepID=UPI0037875611
MTPVLTAATRPGTALDVAERLLRHTADGLPGGAYLVRGAARCAVDWAGPVGAELPDERAVQAVCGIMHVHGRATGGPLPLAVDYASAVAGVLAAQGTTALLLARARGLALTEARTSVAQGALLALAQYLAAATAPYDPDAEAGPARPAGADPVAGGLATLVSAEGVRLEAETLDPGAWRRFWAGLDVAPEVAGHGWWPFQQRFATAVCPLPQALRDAARAAPLAALRAAADTAGVSLLVIGDDPSPAAVPPPWLDTPAPAPRGATAPRCAAGPAAPGTAVLPLRGLRVVESTRRVQGPLTGHLLRLLGADIVRVEPPGGDPMRWLAPLAGDCSARFTALNAGKDVVEADLTTAAGRKTVLALAADADVFLHNWAPGKAARFGLDAPGMLAASPALVCAWAAGFGPGTDGRGLLGTDYLAQVRGGLAAAVRPLGTPAAPSLMTLTDVLGGLVCAQGVLAALLAREGTRRGRAVVSSLESAAALVPRAAHRVRWTPWDLPLRTADGYVCPGPDARSQPEALARLLGPGADPSAGPSGRLRAMDSAAVISRLAGAGLSAVPVRTDLATLPDDPAFQAAVVPADPTAPSRACARPTAPWEFA